ncbi:MAG: DNA mismatch repair endonuclease MutL, partial [Phycisphaerales bacterium]|nr:DNA mismatch repair endonuclease MutL [Phycisphaerales bacterium]
MIRRLSTIVINQIAAGEVVERPASIVKELVENSLDAGAHRIDITLERGGRDMVRVSDDGCGIDASELELAVAPHATSKIENEADLAAIASLGFRGEALASIASVSRFSITSRLPASDAGARLEVEGGDGGLPQPIAAPPGTTVEIKRLFFNTPARRKFLKSDAAETGRAREVVQRLAAAHWQVSFTFQSGERTLLELPAAS